MRKRAKYAKITRPVARVRAPVKSSVDARKVGSRTSLIEVLADPVRWMQTARWCSTEVPSCGNCAEPAPPGTQWDWRCKCSPRLPQARFVCQCFPQTISAAKTAVLIWCFNDRIGVGNAAKMAGVSRPIARGRKSYARFHGRRIPQKRNRCAPGCGRRFSIGIAERYSDYGRRRI